MQFAMTGKFLPHASVDAESNPVAAAAAASLQGSGYAALAFVGCRAHGDRVVLDGSVPTYHLKQLAQTVVQRVAGVGRVDNRLAVRRPGEALRAAP
jgi:osmotically-inducible protein OsmY